MYSIEVTQAKQIFLLIKLLLEGSANTPNFFYISCIPYALAVTNSIPEKDNL